MEFLQLLSRCARDCYTFNDAVERVVAWSDHLNKSEMPYYRILLASAWFSLRGRRLVQGLTDEERAVIENVIYRRILTECGENVLDRECRIEAVGVAIETALNGMDAATATRLRLHDSRLARVDFAKMIGIWFDSAELWKAVATTFLLPVAGAVISDIERIQGPEIGPQEFVLIWVSSMQALNRIRGFEEPADEETSILAGQSIQAMFHYYFAISGDCDAPLPPTRIALPMAEANHHLQAIKQRIFKVLASAAGTLVMATKLVSVESNTHGVDDLVTLDEAAAMVHRSKKTLERYQKQRNSNMPLPFFQGGGGKASLWKWAAFRPWLEEHFVPDLPPRFPRNFR